jgi:hypothetical protein
MDSFTTIKARIEGALDQVAADHGDNYPPVVELRFLLSLQEEVISGVSLPQHFKSYDDWLTRYISLLKGPRGKDYRWQAGDMFAYGFEYYADELNSDALPRIVNEAGVNQSTLRNYGWVSEAFPPEARKIDAAYSIHHELAAIVDKDERYGLLDKAIKDHWTIKQVREARKRVRSSSPPMEPTDAISRHGNQIVIERFVSDFDTAIQKILSMSPGTRFKPSEIYSALIEQRPEISHSTVYNALADLKARQIIKQVRSGLYEVPLSDQAAIIAPLTAIE